MTEGTSMTRSTPASRRRRRPGRLVPYVFIAPFLISFVAFFAAPSVVSIWLSFFRYKGYGLARWIGFQNYLSLFGAPDFWRSFANTAFYWAVPLVPLIGGSFLLALLVRSKLTRWPRTVKPLVFVPQIMAPVAAALVWKVVLSDNGVINALFGIHVGWLSDPRAMRWSVALLLIWRGLGWYFVVFLSGLTAVPDDVLEAAQVDGASSVQRTAHIVIPLMKPIFLFAVVMDAISTIQLFTEPNLLVGSSGSPAGAPPSAAPIMNQVVSNIASGQFGLAAAAGWLIFIAAGVFSLIQFRLFREER